MKTCDRQRAERRSEPKVRGGERRSVAGWLHEDGRRGCGAIVEIVERRAEASRASARLSGASLEQERGCIIIIIFTTIAIIIIIIIVIIIIIGVEPGPCFPSPFPSPASLSPPSLS